MRWSVLLLFFTLSLFSSELDERVNALERKMGEVGMKSADGTFGARFAPETFQRGWIGLFFSGRALYWSAKVGGSEALFTLARNSLGLQESGGDEGTLFDWDWGYRVGAGVHLPLVGGTLAGSYTHFGTEDRRDRIDYDSVDIELRSSSFLSRFLGMETLLGARRVWLDQEYKGRDSASFDGIGPRVGGRLKWYILSGASLLAEVTGSLLYGETHVKQSDLKGSSHLFAANLSFFVGLGWDIYSTATHFGLALGYEAEYYWRQNRMIEVEGRPRMQIGVKADDLAFYGATLKATIEF
ncbi:MAG: hypothetical protein K1060chlam2_00836 [Chlamydiae bacterium]|nr:hypothetical protein [Chlamydiota bacterium]